MTSFWVRMLSVKESRLDRKVINNQNYNTNCKTKQFCMTFLYHLKTDTCAIALVAAKDLTPRVEFWMHGALKLTVPFEVTRGLIFASLLGWRNVLQILTWRCRGIRPWWHSSLAPGTIAERAIDSGRDSLSICLIVNPGWSRPVLIRVCRLLN